MYASALGLVRAMGLPIQMLMPRSWVDFLASIAAIMISLSGQGAPARRLQP
jgi:hypothetical protein